MIDTNKLMQNITNVSTNKFFLGITMLMLNLGSKYLTIDFSKAQEQFFKHSFVRKLTLFSVFFIATRDLIVSLILSLVFILLTQGIFNENSKYSLLSKNSEQDMENDIDYKKAIEIIRQYEKRNPDLNFCETKISSK